MTPEVKHIRGMDRTKLTNQMLLENDLVRCLSKEQVNTCKSLNSDVSGFWTRYLKHIYRGVKVKSCPCGPRVIFILLGLGSQGIVIYRMRGSRGGSGGPDPPPPLEFAKLNIADFSYLCTPSSTVIRQGWTTPWKNFLDPRLYYIVCFAVNHGYIVCLAVTVHRWACQ